MVPTLTKIGTVRAPRSVQFYDCRTPEGREFEGLYRTADGRRLFAAEAPAYFMGKDYYSDFTSLVSVSGSNYRNPASAEDAAKNLRRLLAEAWRNYRRALRHPAKPGKGGSVHYRPAFVEVSNFGYGVVGDRHTQAVRGFDGD